MRKLLLSLLTLAALTSCQNDSYEADYILAEERLKDLESTEAELLVEQKANAELIERLRNELERAESRLADDLLIIEDLGAQYNDVVVEITRLTELLAVANADLDALYTKLEKLKTDYDNSLIETTEYINRVTTLEEEIVIARDNIQTVVRDVQIELVTVVERIITEIQTETVYVNEIVTETVTITNANIINEIVNDTVYKNIYRDNIITNVITETVDVYESITATVTEVVYTDVVVTETVTVVNDIVLTITVTNVIDDIVTETVDVYEINDRQSEIDSLNARVLQLQTIIADFDSSVDNSSILDDITNQIAAHATIDIFRNRDARWQPGGPSRFTTVYWLDTFDQDGNPLRLRYAGGIYGGVQHTYGDLHLATSSINNIKPKYGPNSQVSVWNGKTFRDWVSGPRNGDNFGSGSSATERRRQWINNMANVIEPGDAPWTTNTEFGYTFDADTNVLTVDARVDHPISLKVNGRNVTLTNNTAVINNGGIIHIQLSIGDYRGATIFDSTVSSEAKGTLRGIN